MPGNMAHDDEGHDGHDHSHDDLFEELVEHFQPVLDNCPEGVYLWVDDENTVCNEKMAEMFGTTVEDWSEPGSFLERFVDPKDQEMFAANYSKHVGHLQGPIRFRFKARRQDGKTFTAETDMIPITFAGHAVAYHFVRKV